MQENKQLKQQQNQAQDGRSMVEMLGVLAIIGVISLGGIAGYKMAMDRYQANQIANEINLMRNDMKMKVAQGADLLLGEPYDYNEEEDKLGHLNFNEKYEVDFGFNNDSHDPEEEEETEEGYFISVSGISEGACKSLVTLLDSMDDTEDIKVNNVDYYDTDWNICASENKIKVAFSTQDLGVMNDEEDDYEDEAVTTVATLTTTTATPTTPTPTTPTATTPTATTITTPAVTGISNYCNNHGSVSWEGPNFLCYCYDGYGGTYCETANKCNGHGTWFNRSDGTGYCSCSGRYGGTYCNESNKCNGHGTWKNNSDSTGYCYCSDGYGGTYCNESNKCNHGYWKNNSDGTGYCSCYGSYGGTYCNESNKCNGHGTWYNHTGKGYCSCVGGYGGTYCEETLFTTTIEPPTTENR